jgi:transposase-like protein
MFARSSPGTGRGTRKIAEAGEPRAEFEHSRPLCDRYAAKAAELGVDERTVRRWVKAYEENGEAGLVPARFALQNRIDPLGTERSTCTQLNSIIAAGRGHLVCFCSTL